MRLRFPICLVSRCSAFVCVWIVIYGSYVCAGPVRCNRVADVAGAQTRPSRIDAPGGCVVRALAGLPLAGVSVGLLARSRTHPADDGPRPQCFAAHQCRS